MVLLSEMIKIEIQIWRTCLKCKSRYVSIHYEGHNLNDIILKTNENKTLSYVCSDSIKIHFGSSE